MRQLVKIVGRRHADNQSDSRRLFAKNARLKGGPGRPNIKPGGAE
jgi:hypothetical protein